MRLGMNQHWRFPHSTNFRSLRFIARVCGRKFRARQQNASTDTAKISTLARARPAKYYGLFCVGGTRAAGRETLPVGFSQRAYFIVDRVASFEQNQGRYASDIKLGRHIGLASTSTLQTLTFPAYSVAISSRMARSFCRGRTIRPRNPRARAGRWRVPPSRSCRQ